MTKIDPLNEGPTRLQFNLKSLLISTSFIGAGIGCLLAGAKGLMNEGFMSEEGPLHLIQVLAAGPLLGAGLLVSFRLARVGAYAGFFAPLLWIICNFFMQVPWTTGWDIVLHDPDICPIALPVITLTAFVICMTAFSVIRRIHKRRTKKRMSENLS
jgi:hypothetical protein